MTVTINGTTGISTPGIANSGADSAASQTLSGNLIFTGTGNRITGDFTSATFSNRLAFQSSTANGNTAIAAIPNGTATSATWQTFSSSDINNSSRMYLGVSPASGNLTADYTGTGTYLPMTFVTGGSERMRIDTSGNVGIGTNAPAALLNVKSSSTGTSYFIGQILSGSANGSGGQVYLPSLTWSDATGDGKYAAIGAYRGSAYGNGGVLFYVYDTGNAAVERMRIDSSGNLLLGTAGAVERLTIGNGQSTSSGINLRTTQTDFSIMPSNSAAGGVTIATSWVNGGQGPLIFSQSSGERMRIDNEGRLCVGLSAGIGGSYSTLNLIANGGTQYGITVKNISGSTTTAINFLNSSNAGVGSIVCSTATSYNTGSDYRLKENIQPMQNALGVVAQLNPVTWSWKADGSDGQGFIAHELQVVVPDCVTGEKDAVDENGNPKYQGVDTPFLVATLTKAIQELEARVKQLEGK